jgi:hypothetical protein
LVQDPSFENRGARVLDLADQTDWFGEDKNRTLIVQGNARTGNNFLRLTGGGPQAKVFQRVALKPNTNYTFSFYSRGAASASFTGSVRARFTGVCYVHKPPEECPGGGECCDSVPCCPDIEIEPEGYEEDFDLGPEPPDYKKLILGGVEASGSSDWQFNVVTFNTGKYTEDGIVFYSEAPSDDIDIDDVSLTEGP